jgi:hypothetical protein
MTLWDVVIERCAVNGSMEHLFLREQHSKGSFLKCSKLTIGHLLPYRNIVGIVFPRQLPEVGTAS